MVKKDDLSIEGSIYIIRGQRIMLDFDLARLYGVETKNLKKAVRRNTERFPEDFMFELTKDELKNWRFQFGTSNFENKGLRICPFAFTENGVAMLSAVLNSQNAIHVSISIMRTFTRLRSFLAMETKLDKKIDTLGKDTTKVFKVVFERLDAIDEKIAPILPAKRKKIGLN